MELIFVVMILFSYFFVSIFIFLICYISYDLKGWTPKEYFLTDLEELTMAGNIGRKILFLGGFLIFISFRLVLKIFYKDK